MSLGELQDLEPGFLGLHHEVGVDDIERAVAELLLGGVEAVDDRADVAGPAQRLGHHLGVLDLVVDDQDLGVERGLCGGIGVHDGPDCTPTPNLKRRCAAGR